MNPDLAILVAFLSFGLAFSPLITWINLKLMRHGISTSKRVGVTIALCAVALAFLLALNTFARSR